MWLMMASIATKAKLMVMISATGRRPAMAAPTAEPAIAISEMGVSRTRLRAEFVQKAARDGIGAAPHAHFFAHDEDAVIPKHFFAQGAAERLANGDVFVGHD